MNFQSIRCLLSRAVYSLLLIGLLQACGASDNAFLGINSEANNLRLGSGTGSTFQEGNVSVAENGSTTTVSVNLVDENGNITEADAQYEFSSTCVTQNLASFDTTSVSNTTGTASATYTDQGCTVDNTFTVTATLTDTQTTLTASATVSAQTASVRLGSGSGSSFNNGTLSLSATQIPALGSLTVTANIVDTNGAAFTDNIEVTFSSACVSNSDATLSNETVNTSTGTATTNYTAATCTGTDTITATAQSNGVTLTASGNVEIMPNRIGSTSTGSFVEGSIGLGLNNISINGNTSVTVQIVDFNGDPATSLHTVNFESDCTVSGDSVFDNSGSVNTTNGTASLNYTSNSCGSGSDTIRVTTQSGGNLLTATGSINIAATTLGSISFSNVSNSLIALKGLGTSTLPETTTVTFTVLDDQGQPVTGEVVDFSLDTAVGALSLATTEDISNDQGVVSVVARSGSSPTTFRVNATVRSNTSIASQSTSISVATGPATQDALSLSATTLNPRGFNFDGSISTITARAADRYGNPIQDGTAISFTTEGGSITPSCTTTNGACSVTWTSQNPRPTDGRASILAHLTGEESFTDNNSNGIFDDADAFNFGNASEALFADDDLPEAFQDDNENGIHDTGEPFINFDGSTANNGYTNDDDLFSGPGCTHSTLCSGNDSITIFSNLVIVMAEDSAQFEDDQGTGSDGLDDLTIPNNGSLTVTYTISGANTGQVLPANTTTSYAMSGNSDCVIEGINSFTLGSTNSASVNGHSIKYVCNGTPGSGTMTITVNIPGVNPITRAITITQQ